MNKMRVRLNQVSDIVSFVAIANKCECDVDARCGSIVVDAKSLMGVMSMALCKEVDILFHGQTCEEILQKMTPYAA